MFRRFKSKRGLSPVITTIFLIGIIIAAIGVSLGIIFPSVQELNDQMDLETNSSNLFVLDENFRDMMLNGHTSKLYYTMDLGGTGFLMGDLTSATDIELKYRTVNPANQQVIEDVTLSGSPQNPSIFNGGL